MTNEIKEILEALKSHNDIVKEYPLTLSIEEQKILLDYITNLQDKLKWYENIDPNKTIDKFRYEQNKKVKDLQEENERLTNARYSLDRVELEKRIGKAIEYIDKIFYVKSGLSPKQATDLLNILRGDE